MTHDDQLDRIEALTGNARNTWFILLGVLIFVGVTLLGVEHIDFYGVSRNTELPLVGVSVPTTLFFNTAPVLTVAVYGYFHLYLIRLWDELSVAEDIIGERPLGDAVKPWLVTDSALSVRRWLRKDDCCVPRSLEFATVFWNIVFAWLAGPVVLVFLWHQSLVARDITTSGIAAAMVVFSIIFCFGSAIMLITRMRRVSPSPVGDVRYLGAWSIVLWITAALLIASHTLNSTDGPRAGLAAIDLTGEEIVERPKGWLPYKVARKDFLAVWCTREKKSCQLQELAPEDRTAFEEEWTIRRAAVLADLNRPDWHAPGSVKPDFRDAILTSTFLTGTVLTGAQMEGAILTGAQMEGAVLTGAQMEGAVLSEANLIGAILDRANMQDVILDEANLSSARLQHAILSGAYLNSASLNDTNLNGALLEKVGLSRTHFSGSDMSFSYLSTNWEKSWQYDEAVTVARLNGVRGSGMAIRNAYFPDEYTHFDETTDFRNVFFDGSVHLPARLIGQSGDLCQSVSEILNDEEFFGRWRGWLNHGPIGPGDPWEDFAPIGLPDVIPIPPPPGCEWKTGPMPGTE